MPNSREETPIFKILDSPISQVDITRQKQSFTSVSSTQSGNVIPRCTPVKPLVKVLPIIVPGDMLVRMTSRHFPKRNHAPKSGLRRMWESLVQEHGRWNVFMAIVNFSLASVFFCVLLYIGTMSANKWDLLSSSRLAPIMMKCLSFHYFEIRFLSFGTTADLNIKSTSDPEQTFISFTACPAYGEGYKKTALASLGMADTDFRRIESAR